MKRQQDGRTAVAVEGRDDRLFGEKFFDRTESRIEVSESKGVVCEVIEILEADGFEGMLGVVDPDFDLIDGVELGSDNIVSFDCHDLETMLIRSPALERVLVELGSRRKIEAFEERTGKDVRSALVEAASPIGCLRLHSRRSRLNLRFEGMSIAQFVDRETLGVDKRGLVHTVCQRSERLDLDAEDVEAVMDNLEEQDLEPWNLCHGDDLIGVLGLGLRRALGSRAGTGVSVKALRQSLRLAYESADFAQSHLREQLCRWEEVNEPYRVLRRE